MLESKVNSLQITVLFLYQMGETALIYASRAGKFEIVNMLLSHTAVNVNLQTRNVSYASWTRVLEVSTKHVISFPAGWIHGADVCGKK